MFFVEEDLKEGFEFFPRDARETVSSPHSKLAQLLSQAVSVVTCLLGYLQWVDMAGAVCQSVPGV